MSFECTIICLANSVKNSGFCIAGKQVVGQRFGGWVRPVSARPTGEISLQEMRFADGRTPRLLDVLRIRCEDHAPTRHQKENVRIDPRQHWEKTGHLTFDQVQSAADTPASLWIDGSHTQYGKNDRVSSVAAAGLSSSLYLIRPEYLLFKVSQPRLAYGDYRRIVRAGFQLGTRQYDLKVTDPHITAALLARPDGDHTMSSPSLLCVSLAEEHTDTFCYKLVAAVILPEGARV